jgi:hypothetical protein
MPVVGAAGVDSFGGPGWFDDVGGVELPRAGGGGG